MADEGEPRVLQVVTPNSSILLLDSESRDMLTDPMPTDFGVELNMSVSGGRRIAHRNLQWTQPIYTHNLSDWEIRISFSSINNYQTIFVAYVSPYLIYKVMAQAEGEPLEYTLPNDLNSYAHMLTNTLRHGLRLESDPTVLYDFTGTTVPVLDFQVYFSRWRGFLLSLGQQSIAPANDKELFRMEPCSWMNKAHNVHGYGVRRSTLQNPSITTYQMESSIYVSGTNLWASSATPLGVYTRYALVSSREICRNRKITSFTNAVLSGKMNATEMTIIPITLDALGVLRNNATANDPTFVNLRPGDNLQILRLEIVDEFGLTMQSGLYPGNPLALYIAYLTQADAINPISFNLTSILVDADPTEREKMVTKILKDKTDFFVRQNFVNARMDSGTPIVHYFEVLMF
jgi:hypothetical protein